MLGLYSRTHGPKDAALNLDVSSGQKHTDIPVKSDLSHEKFEEPLYNGKVPEYDTGNMPAKPSIVEATKKPTISPLTMLDPTRVAVIIETRPQPILPAVLAQFIVNVPPAWPVRLVGSQEAFSIVNLSSSLSRHIKSGKLVLTELPDFYPVYDSEALSQTLTNLTFYSEFLQPAEWVLLFQTDSMICSASEQSLDDWVEKGYTWVGAPWNMDVIGGNGGFSLRHVPSIVKVLRNGTRKAGYFLWEDRWLCDQLTNIAPAQVSRTFSVESEYYERPLGYHLRGSGRFLDPNVWKNTTRKRQILKYCPEINIILGQEPGKEEKEEKHLSTNDSALSASSQGTATRSKDENGKQPPETKSPKSATVAATETIESAPGPTETDRGADTKA